MDFDLLHQLRDERDIREVLTRYCRAVDRADAELLRSVYWTDATDDHGTFFRGNAMDFVDAAMKLIKEQTVGTTHMITNVWIQLEGDIAIVESYHLAHHLIKRDDGSIFNASDGGRYLDRLERRNEEWRIAERKALIDWSENMAEMLGEYELNNFNSGSRDLDDDSYRMFAEKSLYRQGR